MCVINVTINVKKLNACIYNFWIGQNLKNVRIF